MTECKLFHHEWIHLYKMGLQSLLTCRESGYNVDSLVEKGL